LFVDLTIEIAKPSTVAAFDWNHVTSFDVKELPPGWGGCFISVTILDIDILPCTSRREGEGGNIEKDEGLLLL
jgi:hypothetical protein